MVSIQARIQEMEEHHFAPKSTVPPEVEEKILLAFGNAIVELERNLWLKFNIISGEIVLGRNEFQWHLENMEARGLICSSEYDEVRSWSKSSC
ncbi:MAG: hypothetical protein RTU92_08200 [Candidatus Thorarchaeota archaeon]